MTLWATSGNQVDPTSIVNISSRCHTKNITRLVTVLKTLTLRPDTLHKEKPDDNLIIERKKRLQAIFSNEYNHKVEVIPLLYFFMCIPLSIASVSILVWWPQHDAIGNPNFWYESFDGCIEFGWAPIAAAYLVGTCHHGLGIGGWISLKKWLIVYLIGLLVLLIMSFLIYILWVYFGEKVWPMPFQGYVRGVIAWNVMIVCFWFQYPVLWRYDPIVRKRLLYGILILYILLAVEMVYKGVLKVFQSVDDTMQWPLAFVLIIIRQLNSKILSNIGQKMVGHQDLSMEIIAINLASARHVMVIATNLGSITTPATSYLILCIDFLTNLFHCIQIIRFHKSGNDLIDSRTTKSVIVLIINEAVEFIMPIAYSIVTLTAYYGPNAELIGNIKSSKWQYTAIENIESTIFWIAMMIFIDFGSILICFILLRFFCRINILRIFLQIIKKVGFLMAIQQVYMLSEVYLYNYIYFAKNDPRFIKYS